MEYIHSLFSIPRTLWALISVDQFTFPFICFSWSYISANNERTMHWWGTQGQTRVIPKYRLRDPWYNRTYKEEKGVFFRIAGANSTPVSVLGLLGCYAFICPICCHLLFPFSCCYFGDSKWNGKWMSWKVSKMHLQRVRETKFGVQIWENISLCMC